MKKEDKMESKPQWYSIKEAVNYLDIKEPTLYRWMKDRKITYRKVGDSTRFLQSDLDEAVRVFHSERDPDDFKAVCPVCHCDMMVDGRLRSTGLNYFQLKKTKFWSVRDSYVKTEAKMCTRCGALSIFGDTDKLKAITKKDE